MTVSNTNNRISYAGNGSTTVFPYPDYFLAAGDLVVVLITTASGAETVQTITTHYSVGTPSESGANITMVTAPASTETLLIYRDPALTQTADYEDNDPFPAATHEQALDRSVMLHIRTREMIGQTFQVPEGETNVPTLPTASERENGVLGFDGDGDPIVISQVAMRLVLVEDSDHTLTAEDMINTHVVFNSTSNRTVTIPTNANATSGVGTHVAISNINTGNGTIQAASGVTLNGTSAGATALNIQRTGGVLYCPKTLDTWEAVGDFT